MTKWLKLSDLPNDFWGECFLGWHVGGNQYSVDISMVRVENGIPAWYCTIDSCWCDFRDDVQYRVSVVEYPKITEEDFK